MPKPMTKAEIETSEKHMHEPQRIYVSKALVLRFIATVHERDETIRKLKAVIRQKLITDVGEGRECWQVDGTGILGYERFNSENGGLYAALKYAMEIVDAE